MPITPHYATSGTGDGGGASGSQARGEALGRVGPGNRSMAGFSYGLLACG